MAEKAQATQAGTTYSSSCTLSLSLLRHPRFSPTYEPTVMGSGASMNMINPVSVKIILDEDLPHGPYAEREGATYALHCPETTSYVDAGRIVVTYLNKEGSDMMKGMNAAHPSAFGNTSFKREVALKEITCKGGPVQREAIVSPGNHTFTTFVKTDVSVNMHPALCCIMM